MKYFFSAIILFLSVSCSKKEQLKDAFINGDDYWACYDELNPGFYSVYYKFRADGKSDRYCEQTNGKMVLCKGSDIIETNIPWEVSNDSVLKWGVGNYDVVTFNKSVIVLYTRGDAKYRRHQFLVKEYPGKFRHGKVYYEEKAKQ